MTAPPVRVARVATSISLNLILANQMEYLRHGGYELVCVGDDDEWADRLQERGFDVWRLGMGRRPGPLRMLVWSVRLFARLRRGRVEVVHTHNAFHGLAGRVVARLAGVPVVVQTVHNWYYLDRAHSRLAPLYVSFERFAARLSDAVLFINLEDLARAVTERIVPARKCRFIGNGIDLASFRAELERADRDGLRAQLGLAADVPVVVMVARLEPPKDHDTFLRALARVLAVAPDVQALLVGYGLERRRIEQEAHALGLDGSIRFLGYRSDVAALLKASDLLVLSSQQEGFGRCLVEAMIARRPVVATDVVGVRDVVTSGDNGLLVPYGSDEAMAEAIVRLLRDHDLAADLCERAHRRALREFDESTAAARVQEIYEELLAHERAASPLQEAA